MICFNLIAFDKTVVPNIHTFYKAFSSNVDRIKHDLENLQLLDKAREKRWPPLIFGMTQP